MKNEEKIIELLTESLMRQDRLVLEAKGTNERLDQTILRLDQTIRRLDQTVLRLDQTVVRLDNLELKVGRIEGELVKLNLQTTENTRAIFKLAEKVEQIADLHDRVWKLEKTVYK